MATETEGREACRVNQELVALKVQIAVEYERVGINGYLVVHSRTV